MCNITRLWPASNSEKKVLVIILARPCLQILVVKKIEIVFEIEGAKL